MRSAAETQAEVRALLAQQGWSYQPEDPTLPVRIGILPPGSMVGRSRNILWGPLRDHQVLVWENWVRNDPLGLGLPTVVNQLTSTAHILLRLPRPVPVMEIMGIGAIATNVNGLVRMTLGDPRLDATLRLHAADPGHASRLLTSGLGEMLLSHPGAAGLGNLRAAGPNLFTWYPGEVRAETVHRKAGFLVDLAALLAGIDTAPA